MVAHRAVALGLLSAAIVALGAERDVCAGCTSWQLEGVKRDWALNLPVPTKEECERSLAGYERSRAKAHDEASARWDEARKASQEASSREIAAVGTPGYEAATRQAATARERESAAYSEWTDLIMDLSTPKCVCFLSVSNPKSGTKDVNAESTSPVKSEPKDTEGQPASPTRRETEDARQAQDRDRDRAAPAKPEPSDVEARKEARATEREAAQQAQDRRDEANIDRATQEKNAADAALRRRTEARTEQTALIDGQLVVAGQRAADDLQSSADKRKELVSAVLPPGNGKPAAVESRGTALDDLDLDGLKNTPAGANARVPFPTPGAASVERSRLEDDFTVDQRVVTRIALKSTPTLVITARDEEGEFSEYQKKDLDGRITVQQVRKGTDGDVEILSFSVQEASSSMGISGRSYSGPKAEVGLKQAVDGFEPRESDPKRTTIVGYDVKASYRATTVTKTVIKPDGTTYSGEYQTEVAGAQNSVSAGAGTKDGQVSAGAGFKVGFRGPSLSVTGRVSPPPSVTRDLQVSQSSVGLTVGVKTGAEVSSSYGVNGGSSASTRATIENTAVLGATPHFSVTLGTNSVDLNEQSTPDQTALIEREITKSKQEVERGKTAIDLARTYDPQALILLNEDLTKKRQRTIDLLELRRSLEGVSSTPGPVR
jgi:hypothetical protein